MKMILSILFCFCFHCSLAQFRIIDCVVETNSTNSKLYVFLTDTLNFLGVNIKIGSEFDNRYLFNQEYMKTFNKCVQTVWKGLNKKKVTCYVTF